MCSAPANPLSFCAAEKNSGHVMHALAEQLKETFTKSGMTPEDLFNTFEKDGDGEIGKEEFKRMLMSLGANIQMKQIEDLFTLLDSDGGGEVDVVSRTRNLCRQS